MDIWGERKEKKQMKQQFQNGRGEDLEGRKWRKEKKKKWDRKDFRSNKGRKEKALWTSSSIQKEDWNTTSVGMSGQLVLGTMEWLYRAECCSVTFSIGNRKQRGH